MAVAPGGSTSWSSLGADRRSSRRREWTRTGPPRVGDNPKRIPRTWLVDAPQGGSILSVTVSATISRSAWRVPWATDMTPNRMKSYGHRGCDQLDPATGQPVSSSNREWRRPPLRMNLSGRNEATPSDRGDSSSLRPITLRHPFIPLRDLHGLHDSDSLVSPASTSRPGAEGRGPRSRPAPPRTPEAPPPPTGRS